VDKQDIIRTSRGFTEFPVGTAKPFRIELLDVNAGNEPHETSSLKNAKTKRAGVICKTLIRKPKDPQAKQRGQMDNLETTGLRDSMSGGYCNNSIVGKSHFSSGGREKVKAECE
jgi:hypothetical protein